MLLAAAAGLHRLGVASRPAIRSAAWAALAVAVLSPVPAGTAVAAAGAPANALVLFSNSRLVRGNADVERGLRQGLTSVPPVQLFFEFLDSPEFDGESHERTVTAYLRDKYAGRPPDVLVAFSDAAFEFAMRNRAVLFPGRPLVYASVSPTVLRRHALADDVVGIPVEYDFSGTIEQALRWHPRAERLVVVTGASSRDRGWEARLRREVPSVANGRRVEFWAGLPTQRLLEQLAGLDARTIVFTPGYYIDGSGALTSPGASIVHIARASAAPVYGPLPTFIGSGIVGGRMASFEDAGRQAGTIVTRLLGGAPPGSLRNPAPLPTALHVDWRQVERFGIRHADIPPDAVVHFRAPTFWEQYRAVAVIAVSVILVQAGLIAALLLERRRRRVAEIAAQKHRVELAHASRLAVAGELTASIAHEINQPLGAVQTSADAADLLLRSDIDHRDDLRRIVARLQRDSVRAGDVVRRLRRLLARHEPERRPVDLGATLHDAAQLLGPESRRRSVALDLRLPPHVGTVLGDQTQIGQVLINLVLNAMDAVADVDPDRRVVRIVAERVGGRARVSVHDRGKGIATADLPKVFDSFFSTKPKGMGLWLSIARTLVEAHGGGIEARSDAVQGTTFSFELPLLAESGSAATT